MVSAFTEFVKSILIIKEAGGTTNDYNKYADDSIDIRAASSSIYSKMMKKLINF